MYYRNNWCHWAFCLLCLLSMLYIIATTAATKRFVFCLYFQMPFGVTTQATASLSGGDICQNAGGCDACYSSCQGCLWHVTQSITDHWERTKCSTSLTDGQTQNSPNIVPTLKNGRRWLCRERSCLSLLTCSSVMLSSVLSAQANEFREDQWKFQLRERRLAVREAPKYVRTWPHVLGYFTYCKPGHFVTWSRLVLEWWRDCRGK